jgi:hypothetical protein
MPSTDQQEGIDEAFDRIVDDYLDFRLDPSCTIK